MEQEDRTAMKWGLRGTGIVIALILSLLFWPAVIITAGHRGVVTLFGEVQQHSLQPGLNWVNPMIAVHTVNTQIQKAEAEGVGASKDLQQVHTKLAVNYNLASDSVQRLYQDVGMDYETKIIQPAISEAFKAVTAKYTATELIEKRGEVKALMQISLSEAIEKVSARTIVVDEVFITSFSFNESFAHAIEEKQVAEQQILTEQRKLTKAKIVAEQRVATAEGEAKAIAIQAQSINSQGGKAYVDLKAIEKWNGIMPVYMTAGAPTPFFNVGQAGK